MQKTLEQLKADRWQTVETEVVDWGGTVTIGRLSPRDRVELLERINGKMGEDGVVPIGVALDEYVWAISKTVQSPSGEPVFDSDEGREFLYGERLDVLTQAFQCVVEFNLGNMEEELETAKKN